MRQNVLGERSPSGKLFEVEKTAAEKAWGLPGAFPRAVVYHHHFLNGRRKAPSMGPLDPLELNKPAVWSTSVSILTELAVQGPGEQRESTTTRKCRRYEESRVPQFSTPFTFSSPYPASRNLGAPDKGVSCLLRL